MQDYQRQVAEGGHVKTVKADGNVTNGIRDLLKQTTASSVQINLQTFGSVDPTYLDSSEHKKPNNLMCTAASLVIFVCVCVQFYIPVGSILPLLQSGSEAAWRYQLICLYSLSYPRIVSQAVRLMAC